MYFLGINNGIIININDASGLNLLPMNRNRPAYLASKCALTTLTDCLRSELAQCESNIKVIVSHFSIIFILISKNINFNCQLCLRNFKFDNIYFSLLVLI